MKNVLLICFVVVGFTLQAQPGKDSEFKNRKEIKEKMAALTPQQRAELKTKKMTLHLELNETQQNKIQSLLVKQEEKIDAFKAQRKEGKELSKDEMFALKSQKFDEEIAFKKELKSILTEEQFTKFEKSRMHNGKMKRQHEKRKKE